MSQTDDPEISNAPETPAPQQEAAPQFTPKSQLARRVVARLKELEAYMETLGDEPMQQKRRGNIVAAIRAAHSTMNLNAERMSPGESQLMARWLETSQYLTS